VCEEDILSIRKIIARRPSGVTRSFTLIELDKAGARDPEVPVADAASPAKK